MSNEDRTKLVKALEKSIQKAKSMSKEQAKAQLVKEGFYTEEGTLSPKYGGPQTAA